MHCKKCEVYLYDYLHQELLKDNPLKPLVNMKKVKENVYRIISILLHLLFELKKRPFVVKAAQANKENYCTFVEKPASIYKEYQIYYAFVLYDKEIASLFKSYYSEIYDLGILKLKGSDKKLEGVGDWMAFLVGSLFDDLYILHQDHSKNSFAGINIDRGLPGFPSTAKKLKKAPVDDLYI